MRYKLPKLTCDCGCIITEYGDEDYKPAVWVSTQSVNYPTYTKTLFGRYKMNDRKEQHFFSVDIIKGDVLFCPKCGEPVICKNKEKILLKPGDTERIV